MRSAADVGGALGVALRKMCEWIDVDPSTVDVDDDGWYARHEWTADQQSAFSEWLVGWLSRDRAARRELIAAGGVRSKDMLRRTVAPWFVVMWGWRIKEGATEVNDGIQRDCAAGGRQEVLEDNG